MVKINVRINSIYLHYNWAENEGSLLKFYCIRCRSKVAVSSAVQKFRLYSSSWRGTSKDEAWITSCVALKKCIVNEFNKTSDILSFLWSWYTATVYGIIWNTPNAYAINLKERVHCVITDGVI